MKHTKEKILSVICLALSLMGIIMLFFPILNYSWRSYYGNIRQNTDSGFSLLLFNSEGIDEEYLGILGVLSWFQFIIGIVMFIKSCLMFKQEHTRVTPFITVVISISISAFLYLLEGIIAKSIAVENGVYNASHLTWIPFIIISILSVLAIIYIDSFKKQAVTVNAYSKNLAGQSINNTATIEDGSLFTVDGEVKLLKVYNDYVTMENKVNLRAIVTHNVFGGTKKIFYQNMIGVQFKESSTLILGYIQFETANTFSKDNFNSENSVTFSHLKASNEYVKEVVSFVEGKIIASKTPNTSNQPFSLADELLKFKKLLDAGAISQEEYEQKKNELLNK